MISFGAKYISSAVIQKIDRESGRKEPCKVSFIELDPKNETDINAAEMASERWGLPEYSEDICNDMRAFFQNRKSYNSGTNKFYAITEQTKYFEQPESSQMLALCQLDAEDKLRIRKLQAKPEGGEIFKKPFEYNHVGTGMLNPIKMLFSGKNISLFTTPTAKLFYAANGFKENKNCKTEMYYEA